MRKQYLECGKIVTTHGVRGEVRVQPWCDSPEYLCDFGKLYLQNGEKALTVERARVNKNIVLLKVKGIDTLDDAVLLRGKVLYIDRRDDPDSDSDTFIADLIGLEVVDADNGKSYGKLADVLSTGANDVYSIKDENGFERLIPAIPDVIIKTDIDGGVMRIRPLKGLFDDED